MKTVLFALAFTFAAFFVQAQNGLKGPAAKNAKPWKNDNKVERTVAMKSDNATKLQGPAAKNNKVWAEESQAVYTEVAVVSDRPELKGPAAKNHKVWADKDQANNSVLVKKNTENNQK